MGLIEQTLEEHIKLLNQLGYELDVPTEDIPKYRSVPIYYNGDEKGDISFKNLNLYYLYRDKRIMGNRDLSKINFNKRKIKNMRGTIHTYVRHRGLLIDCYNQLISTNDNVERRDYIVITDNENYRITKYLGKDEIEVVSLRDDIPNDEIISYLRSSKKEKKLTHRIEGV